jgi:hypothetical protein
MNVSNRNFISNKILTKEMLILMNFLNLSVEISKVKWRTWYKKGNTAKIMSCLMKKSIELWSTKQLKNQILKNNETNLKDFL